MSGVDNPPIGVYGRYYIVKLRSIMELSEVMDTLTKLERSGDRVRFAFKRPDGSTDVQAEFMSATDAKVSASVLYSVGCSVITVYRSEWI